MLGCVVLGCVVLGANVAGAQTGSITGTISTSAKGPAPVRVTIDQKVCGNELADEAVVVDAQGHLANAVVILTGVKRVAAEAVIMNEKCRFAPRVQVAGPNSPICTLPDALLSRTDPSKVQ